MTQEEKELLLKDLCARLPYNFVYCYCNAPIAEGKSIVLTPVVISNLMNATDDLVIKPYLRPMSSMTEEEKEELISKCTHAETEEDWEGVRSDVWGIQILDKYDTRRWDNTIWVSTINMDAIDWLNSHHFDYRGLIKLGLAIEAPKNMYKI